jgi:hypothetical protein
VVIDVAFLLIFAGVALNEIIAGRNWRNLRVLIVLGVLIIGNIVFHAEVIHSGSADYGIRIGIAALVGLIVLVGGRIVPSFTLNWLVRNNPGRLPQPFSRFDAVTIGASALALICWIALPQFLVSGVLLIIAGLLESVRHVRWAGDRTLADRLVLVLHVAYAFVPIGFFLIGASVLWPTIFPTSADFHAWTAGAVGLTTLAVMTRASRGHTGQELAASLPTQLILCAPDRRADPHRGGIRTVARSPSHCRRGLPFRHRRLCHRLWPLASRAAAGLERAQLTSPDLRLGLAASQRLSSPAELRAGTHTPVHFSSIERTFCDAALMSCAAEATYRT